MIFGKIALAVILAALAGTVVRAGTLDELNRTAAAHDMAELRQQVEEFARLVNAEVGAQGVEAATEAFRTPLWRRQANGFHIWGVTTTGTDWLDTSYPEFENLVISEMSDLNGRYFAELALASAYGSGEKTFEVTFPHPSLKIVARGLEQCFPIKDSDRVLCAGAFLDSE